MGELFQRYFELLAGRCPGAEYGVIATPADLTRTAAAEEPAEAPRGCLCPGR
jgi:hypothetical protein